MAQIIRSAKHSLIEDLINGRKTLTSPAITAITGTTSITALTGNALTITGADGYDVKVKLGDDDAGENFIVEEVDGDDLFKVGSTGIITLKGGTTLDNVAAANELNITETTVKVTGILSVTGTGSISGGLNTLNMALSAGSPTYGIDLDASTPTTADIRLSNAVRINNPSANSLWLGVADADIKYMPGEMTTRNNANDSMYVPVSASLAHERLWKVAGKVTANDGGYFEALYVNAATTTTATGGRIVGTESKVTINANMDAGATAEALYAKISVANASEVATAYGLYVEMEENGTGAITVGNGVYVKGNQGAIDYAINVDGAYRMAAMKLPYAEAGAAISPAQLATSFGITEGAAAGDDGIVGIYNNTGGSGYLVIKMGGLYKSIELVDVA